MQDIYSYGPVAAVFQPTLSSFLRFVPVGEWFGLMGN